MRDLRHPIARLSHGIGPWLQRCNRTWLLLVLCALLYLPGLAALPVTDRDEARYVQASRQMVDSGHWIDIRFQDQTRYKKPIGIYWLQAAASTAGRALGLPATARAPYRMPSALGATAAVLMTYRGFRGLLGEPGAFRAALLLGGSLLIGVEAHLAKTDGVLLAFVVAMQVGLAQLYCRPQAPAAPGSRLLFWAGLGLGILIKGPVAPTIALLTLAWLCIRERSLWPAARLRPWPWLLLPVLIVGPWLWSIQGMSSGQFLHDSLGRDVLAKVIEGQESHGAPPGTYLLVTPFVLWPVSWLLLPQAWRGAQPPPDGLADPAPLRIRRFAQAWLIPAWIVFELVPTKLAHYVLPLIPALCLLAGLAPELPSLQPRAPAWLGRAALAIWIATGAALAIAVPAVAFWATRTVPWSAAGVSVISLAFLLGAPRLPDLSRRLAASAAATVLISGLLFSAVLPGLTPLWPAESLRQILARHHLQALPISLTGYGEPSAVFNLGTNTQLGDLAETARLLKHQGDAVAIVPSSAVDSLRASTAGQGITLRAIERLQAVNYSKGRRLDLTVLLSQRRSSSPVPENP